jgi:hypothetical protein
MSSPLGVDASRHIDGVERKDVGRLGDQRSVTERSKLWQDTKRPCNELDCLQMGILYSFPSFHMRLAVEYSPDVEKEMFVWPIRINAISPKVFYSRLRTFVSWDGSRR